MTLDNWGCLRIKWLNLVDKMASELYTIDEHFYYYVQLIRKYLDKFKMEIIDVLEYKRF